MEPKQEYRDAIIAIGRSGYTVISSDYRKSLDVMVKRLSLPLKDAVTIEDEVLASFRQYEKELVEKGLKEYPLTDLSQQHIKNLQKVLGLEDIDVSGVHSWVFGFLDSVHDTKMVSKMKSALILSPGAAIPLAFLLPNPVTFVAAMSSVFTFWAGLGVDYHDTNKRTYANYMHIRYGEDWKQ